MSKQTLHRLRSTAGVLILCLFAAALTVLAGPYPDWWHTRGVVRYDNVTNDYAAVNAGQLKWFAVNAKAELDTCLPGGAGSAVDAMIAGFSATNNYVAINVGQLKNVAKPFYDRLIAVGYTNTYPWTTGSTTDDCDFAGVNLGQLKTVFNFDLSSFNLGADVDGDGMPDVWETQYFGNLAQTATGDFDSDGVNNLTEYLQGRDPTKGFVPDTNGQVRLSVYSPFE